MIALCILLNNGSTRTVCVQSEPSDDLLAKCREIIRRVQAEDRISTPPEDDDGQRPPTVQELHDYNTVNGNPLEEALQDNTRTPPPDAVAFRCDFPAWLTTRTERDRRIIEQLGMSERTSVVALRFGVADGRISQLRSEYREDWTRFCGE